MALALALALELAADRFSGIQLPHSANLCRIEANPAEPGASGIRDVLSRDVDMTGPSRFALRDSRISKILEEILLSTEYWGHGSVAMHLSRFQLTHETAAPPPLFPS